MNKALLPITLLVLLGMLGWLWLASAGVKNSPDITLMSIDGEPLALSAYRGQPVLVTFWATSCTVCLREMPQLIELYRELAPQGLEIIGIAMDYDPPNQVLAVRNARKIPYPVALDIHAQAAHAFGNVRFTPTTFLIAPDGRIVFRKVGNINMQKLRADILGALQRAALDHGCRPIIPDSRTCSG